MINGKKDSLLRLSPYAAYLQHRWSLPSARSAGKLANTFIDDYCWNKASYFETLRCHSLGWSVRDWRIAGVTKETKEAFLSTVDYFRMHPLNGSYSSWIDDKLTLKYLCLAKGLGDLMPGYYYQVASDGSVIPLPDCPEGLRWEGVDGLLNLLTQNGILAVKRIKGSCGVGFYKAEARDGQFYLNDVKYDEESFKQKLVTLTEYVITDYLFPHEELAVFSKDTPNTIRYQVGREGKKILFLKAEIRFGTEASGFVENYSSGGVACYISEEGYFSSGNVMDPNTGKNIRIDSHPDTGVKLCGKIPLWKELKASVNKFCEYFPQLQYLGFDFVITDTHQVKLLEINSLSSLGLFQTDCSFLESPNSDFFKTRLAK